MNEMIGQKILLKQIYSQIDEGIFPRFSIFVGQFGDEKNKFAYQIADYMRNTGESVMYASASDCKVDTIRNIIEESYKCTIQTVYAINDVDDMSLQAKNSLLKITEEPPNKAYFVMTINDLNNTLPTIRSRASIYYLDRYSYTELGDYISLKYPSNIDALDTLFGFCETPGDIDIIFEYGVSEFYSFICKVVDNISAVSGSNALKISGNIQIKDSDPDKYDLRLFWKAFCSECFRRHYLKAIKLTSQYLSALHTKSINKGMLFDMWLFDIRKEWKDGCC